MNIAVFGGIIPVLIWLGQVQLSDGEAESFGNEILTLTNEVLGSSAFKSYLKQGDKFLSDRLEPDSMVKQLAINIESKITSREKAVKRLKEVVTQSFKKSSWGDYTECCRYSDYDLKLVYDHRFLGKVDVDSLCIMQSSLATKKHEVPSDDFLRAAMENLGDSPGMKAQYFGSDGGTLLSFPASTVSNCGNYDNRFRPWYVQASAPVPKDIVIVMDMSGSMEKENRLQAAIHAATTILESLSPDDRVAVVGFSDYAYAVGSGKAQLAISSKNYGGLSGRLDKTSCFDTTMVKATPRNVHLLSSAVAKMVPHGGTNYTTGLKIAFDFLFDVLKRDVSESCGEGKPTPTEIAFSRHRTIIFLSDGKPSDLPAGILELVYHQNRQMHNSVVLLCYALGKGTFGHFIQEMSRQYYVPGNIDTCSTRPEDIPKCEVSGSKLCNLPPPRTGLYRHVIDSQYLRSEMGSYYNYFATESAKVASFSKLLSPDNIVWSVPYFDAGGLGMVITAASSIVLQNRLVGVVGTDLTMREMMAEVTYFHAGGQASYAFVMDNTGRVLLHPYMPSPSAVAEDPVLTDIGAFERTPGVKKFLDNILSQAENTGSLPVKDAEIYRTSVQGKRTLPQEHRNVITRDAQLSYSCLSVRHLVVCVVTDGEIASNTKFTVQDLPKNFSFSYHRFDISSPDGICRYQGGITSGTKSAVFLAPSAFKDVGMHLGHPETSQWISELERYFSDPNKNYMGTNAEEMAAEVNLKPGIRDAVRVTSRLEEIWNSQLPGRITAGNYISRENLRRSVIYRYFSSENGVFRIHPGVRMPKSYNPIHRPWYEQARSLLTQKLAAGKECNSGADICGDVAAVSPPYLDASGAGVVVTISQAIVAPTPGTGASQAGQRHVVGVMGGDVRLAFLGSILSSSITGCKKDSGYNCILIDLAGYVIYDQALAGMDETTIEHLVETNYHITYAHRVMAEELVKNRILVRQQCADVSKVAYLEEYRVDLERLAEHGPSLSFTVVHINYTNTVLLIVANDFWVPQYINQKQCIKHELNSVTCERPAGSDQCESPCVNSKEAKRDHEACTNTFNYTWNHHPPPCLPDKFIDERLGIIVEGSGESHSAVEISVLEPCFDNEDVEDDGDLESVELATASISLGFALFATLFMALLQRVANMAGRGGFF